MSYKKNPKNPDGYLDNLFLAVTDIFWDMKVTGISTAEARKLINRDVKMVIDESLRQFKTGNIR
tara:strand:+ start:326 stop:517 length:192 start_codon:yes stop_codon:yes gene_type:complete